MILLRLYPLAALAACICANCVQEKAPEGDPAHRIVHIATFPRKAIQAPGWIAVLHAFGCAHARELAAAMLVSQYDPARARKPGAGGACTEMLRRGAHLHAARAHRRYGTWGEHLALDLEVDVLRSSFLAALPLDGLRLAVRHCCSP